MFYIDLPRFSVSVPYHPETNAIEEFFSQLKHYIKNKVRNHLMKFIKQKPI